MDAKNLTYQSETFDGIIDKALYDSVLVTNYCNFSVVKMPNKTHINYYAN